MTENQLYGVWLQQAAGEGSRKIPSLLEYFGSAKNVFLADKMEIRLSGILGPRELPRFFDTTIDVAEEILEACERLGYSILTPDDERYPDRLRNIPDYPAALYVCGELPQIDDEVCIAMVGTRRASRYGITTATTIAKDLASCGAIVVSGCAKGIDTAAHQGALLGDGRTIAVLGCGINTRYNMENEKLRNVISRCGALVSEYPPGAPPLGYHFPIRNRIISALSLGVIVVEAGAQSGSLITANIALEQGKDIFSVPGAINNYLSKGTNRLIFDGAVPIESAVDVLSEYVAKFPHRLKTNHLQKQYSRVYEKDYRRKRDRETAASEYDVKPEALPPKPVKNDKPAKKATSSSDKVPEKNAVLSQSAAEEFSFPIGVSESAQRVWNALDTVPKHFHDLMAEVDMDSSALSRCLTELELYALVRALPGNKYTKG